MSVQCIMFWATRRQSYTGPLGSLVRGPKGNLHRFRGWTKMRPFARLVAAFSLLAALPAHSLTLTPGTLLGLDSVGRTIYQYDTAGNVLDSLAVTLASTSAATGITTVDGRVFIFQQGAGGLLEVDLATGITSFVFDPNVGREDLGRIGSNLILSFLNGPVTPGAVEIYSTSGILVDEFTVATLISGGIDSDGVRIYMADQPSGIVRVLDLEGVELSSFPVLHLIDGEFVAGTPSGLAFDEITDTLWVADFDLNVVSQYSSTGTYLGGFSTSGVRTDGLTFVQTPAVPSISTFGLGLLSIGLIGGAVATLRRRRSM